MNDGPHSQYGFYAVVAALFALVAVFGITLYFKGEKITDVTALLSTVGTVIGTIVGAYFGVAVGAAGKAKSDNDKDVAEKQVKLLSGKMDEAKFHEVINANRALFLGPNAGG